MRFRFRREREPVQEQLDVNDKDVCLPADIWINILSFLSRKQLGQTLLTCKTFYSNAKESWKLACYRRWPEWSNTASNESNIDWLKVYEMLELREQEECLVPNASVARQLQKVITFRHRAILTEWMCEVSCDWQLESTIVYRAVDYLDQYLYRLPVEKLSRFQLLGVSCLRAAMMEAPKPITYGTPEEEDKAFDPRKFSHICADQYTPEEVEKTTQIVLERIPSELKPIPNSKMFLRSFWYRTTLYDIASSDEMHIYVFASFLLQLSLLDWDCAGIPGSLLAAGAMSLALSTFGKPAWPEDLQRFGSYVAKDVEPVAEKLAGLQASVEGLQLRDYWRATVGCACEYKEYSKQWRHLQSIVAKQGSLKEYSDEEEDSMMID